MKISLSKLVKTMDDFGHPINVTYKGEETHQSIIGGTFSVLVKVLTLILSVKAA